jgi:hypothetical protein
MRDRLSGAARLDAYADALARLCAQHPAWHLTRAPDALTLHADPAPLGGHLRADVSTRAASWTLRGGLDGLDVARPRAGEPFSAGALTLDATFDERVLVQGQEPTLSAALSAEARALLTRAVLSHGLTAEDGTLRLTQRLSASADPAGPVALLTDLYRALRADPDDPRRPCADPWRRVAANALRDPLPQARKRCLKLLLTLPADAPPRAHTLTAALNDRRPDVALLAAEALGSAGVLASAKLAADPLTATDQRRQALAHALHRGAPSDQAKLLRALLRDPHTPAPLLRDAMLALQPPADAPPQHTADLLLPHLRHDDPTVQDALARALRRVPAPDAERALIHLLLLCPHDQPKLSAAQSLGVIGGVDAVGPLSATAEDSARARALRDAARISLQHVRARLLRHGLDAGHLSLTDPDDPHGALALSPPAPKPDDDDHA